MKQSSFLELGANQPAHIHVAKFTTFIKTRKCQSKILQHISNILVHDICSWQAIAKRVEKIYFLWHKLSTSAYISPEMFHKFMLDYFNYFYSNFV